MSGEAKQHVEFEASRDAYLEFYRIQWADVHHTRHQDWELSKLVIAGAIGIAGLKFFGEYPRLQVAASLTVAALSLLALLITIRHWMHWQEKKKAIREVERVLGIDGQKFFKKKKNFIERHFHTQVFLIVIYFVTTLFFVFLCFIEIKY